MFSRNSGDGSYVQMLMRSITEGKTVTEMSEKYKAEIRHADDRITGGG